MLRYRFPLLLFIVLTVAGCGSPYEKGVNAFEQGRWKESIEFFSQVKTYDKHSESAEQMIAEACFNIGQQALAAGNWDEAIEYLPRARTERYAEAKQMIDQARFGRGKQAFERQEWNSAINDFLLVRPESAHYAQARELLSLAREQRSS